MLWLLLHFILYGGSGFRDETLAAYADPGRVYHLEEIRGAATLAETEASVRFPKIWRIEWQTTCATYGAKLTVPYPWVALKAVRETARLCPEDTLEADLLALMQDVRLAEILGDVLILSDGDGPLLVFRAQR